jgi:ABC-type transporter Mla subunit MlaD
MPDFDKLIEDSQRNVKSLSEKLKDLDKLHQDISSLKDSSKGIPDIFKAKFDEIVKLSTNYTNVLGGATKTYLDGNNTLFTTKLSELSSKLKDFDKEVSRLINTDFNVLFKDLQKIFIDQTRKDLEIQLKRFEEKAKDLQTKNEALGKQVERLTKVDLEKGFDKLQKTLSDIFGAINVINLTLTGLTTSLNSVIQSLGQIQKTIEDNFKETNKLITTFSTETNSHLNQQDKKNDIEFETLKKEVENLSQQNNDLKKEITTNKVIQIVGLVITIALLIYLIIKD